MYYISLKAILDNGGKSKKSYYLKDSVHFADRVKDAKQFETKEEAEKAIKDWKQKHKSSTIQFEFKVRKVREYSEPILALQEEEIAQVIEPIIEEQTIVKKERKPRGLLIFSTLLVALTLSFGGLYHHSIKPAIENLSAVAETVKDGEQGIQGEVGAKGDKGEKGDQGIQGQKGDKGNPGTDGEDGKDAVTIQEQTLSKLNTKLATINAEDYNTVYERLEAAGITNTQLKRLSKNYLYSYKDNRFICVDDAGYVIYTTEGISYTVDSLCLVDNNLYQFNTSNDISLDYANYIVGGTSTTITTDKSFDAGEYLLYEDIYYINHGDEQSAILRTNGGFLTIDAPNDTVEHYGYADYIDVIAVADHSFISYGNAKVVQIRNGHIVVSADSQIEEIHISKQDIETFGNIVITVEDGADLPKLSRDSVDIEGNEEVKVCTIETVDKKEDVIITKQGVAEQVILRTAESDRYATYESNPLTNQDDIQNSAANMLANELTSAVRDNNGSIVDGKLKSGDSSIEVNISFNYETREFEFTSDAVLTEEQEENLLENVSLNTGKELSSDVIKASLKNNYDLMIAKVGENTVYCSIQDFRDNVNNGTTYEGYYITQLRDIYLNEDADAVKNFAQGDLINWVAIGQSTHSYIASKPFKGIYDGSGFTIYNLYQDCYHNEFDGSSQYGLFGCIEDATIKNLTIDNYNMRSETNNMYTYYAAGSFVGVAFGGSVFENLTLRNSYLCGYLNATGAIVGGVTQGNFTFENINVDNTNYLTTWYNACDTALGGLIGVVDIQYGTNAKLETSTVTVRNSRLAGQIMPINDVLSNYAWYKYRSSGSLIGGFTQNKADGMWNNTDNISDENLNAAVTCENVTIIYDLWNHQYYCKCEHISGKTYSGNHCARLEDSKHITLHDLDCDRHGSKCNGEHDCLIFDQLVGGWSGGTWKYETGTPVRAINGVNVIYLNDCYLETVRAKIGTQAYGTFVEALENAVDGSAIILYNPEINLGLSETKEINKNITIKALTATTVNVDQTVQLFKVVEGGSLTLENIIFDGQTEFTLDRNGLDTSVELTTDNANKKESVLYVSKGGSLVINNCQFNNFDYTNTSTSYYGATAHSIIRVYGADGFETNVEINNSVFSYNIGKSSTLVCLDNYATGIIKNTLISNNVTVHNENHGLLSSADSSQLTLENVEIANNTYNGNGIISCRYGKIIVEGGSVHDNYGGKFCGSELFLYRNKNGDVVWNNGRCGIFYVHAYGELTINETSFVDNTIYATTSAVTSYPDYEGYTGTEDFFRAPIDVYNEDKAVLDFNNIEYINNKYIYKENVERIINTYSK